MDFTTSTIVKSPFLITTTYLFLQVSNLTADENPKKDSHCGNWASVGECNVNPSYMLHEDCGQNEENANPMQWIWKQIVSPVVKLERKFYLIF